VVPFVIAKNGCNVFFFCGPQASFWTTASEFTRVRNGNQQSPSISNVAAHEPNHVRSVTDQ